MESWVTNVVRFVQTQNNRFRQYDPKTDPKISERVFEKVYPFSKNGYLRLRRSLMETITDIFDKHFIRNQPMLAYFSVNSAHFAKLQSDNAHGCDLSFCVFAQDSGPPCRKTFTVNR